MGFTFSNSSGGSNALSVPGGYRIMRDSGIVEANPETGPQAIVKFKVYDANDRYSFVQQLLGLWTGTPPTNIIYSLPYLYPPSPNLLCTSVLSIEGLGRWAPMSGVPLPWLFGQSAIVTAMFTRPPWQAMSSQGFFSLAFSAGGEFLTLPETTFQFPDGTPTNTPIGLLIPEAEVIVTRHRMPFIPDAYAMQLLGTLNNAPFAIGWNIYPRGTLLFGGINSEVAADPLGNITYTVMYRFMYRYKDWNMYFHPDRTTGFAYVTDGNGSYPYNYANFDLLP